MPSRIRVVYISKNANRRERNGNLRGNTSKPAILKFYGKAALRAAEEDAISNWGEGGVVMEVLGAPSYRRASIWSKFHRMERGGILLGKCWIGREARSLPPKKSGFVRFLTLQGYETHRKKMQPGGQSRVQPQTPYRANPRLGGIPGEIEGIENQDVLPEGYLPPQVHQTAAPGQNPPRIGIWN